MHEDHLLKTKRIQKLKETGALRYIYQNELNKAYFQHDMAYRDFKDLPRRTVADKICDKTCSNAKNPKYDGYQRVLLIKKTASSAFENGIMQNKELVEELHKPIVRKFEKQKVPVIIYR